jgi:nicotinamidase-related amidase
MSESDTALLVIDVQDSFRIYSDADVPAFVERIQKLIDGAKARNIPVVQVFHVADSGPFSIGSGLVKTFSQVSVVPDAVFHKRKHSALVGSGLDVWLIQNGIRRLIVCGIKTEQCCETTTRHASDMGYAVDFVSEATLTFAMKDAQGHNWSAAEIKARSELVLDKRFARIATVEQALAGPAQKQAA